MKLIPNRNKSWTAVCQKIDIDEVVQNAQEIPVKYLLAEQMFKAASRRDDFVKQQLGLMVQQNILLEKIKDLLTVKERTINILDESCIEQESYNAKDSTYISKKHCLTFDQLNTTVSNRRFRQNKGEQTLFKIQRHLGRQDYEYVLNLINQNILLKKEIDDQDKYKCLLESQRKHNQTLRLQNLKFQSKICQMDKQLIKANNTVKSFREQKQNYSESIRQIQSQIKINTSTTTHLMINQKILKNQRKRFELQKQMLRKIKLQLNGQLQQIQSEWNSHLPDSLVKQNKENINRYTRLLEEQYSKIKGLNYQIQNFNSRMCIM